jgi:non-homologous end joining protein Ku
MNQGDLFADEVVKTKTKELTKLVTQALSLYVMDGFFLQPASMSGKYHPYYALGEGGLIRHTVAAMQIAREIAKVFHLSPLELDLCVTALALHDICKPDPNHAEQAAVLIRRIDNEHAKLVAGLIESHMGQWGPKECTDTASMNFFVHCVTTWQVSGLLQSILCFRRHQMTDE